MMAQHGALRWCSLRTALGSCLALSLLHIIVSVIRQNESFWGNAPDDALFNYPIAQAISSLIPSFYNESSTTAADVLSSNQSNEEYPLSPVDFSQTHGVDGASSSNQEEEVEFIPIPKLNLTANEALNHPHAGSRFPNGTFGYIANPKSLRESVQAHDEYFDRIAHLHKRYRIGTFTHHIPLTPAMVCHQGPGRSFEAEGGFKLLTEKIRIAPPLPKGPRILCSIYTYTKMRDLARMQALTWGHECDGFLAFSTETIPELGILEILHAGEETYQNMWQKVRSIWTYIFTNYLDDYDWFHLGGDDLYLLVHNLRRFLNDVDGRKANATKPIFLGSRVRQEAGSKYSDFVAGAPGYTLNRAALQRFITDLLPTCRDSHQVSHEDRYMSRCFAQIGIGITETRDYATGEPQYHDCHPDHLYTFRTLHNPSFHGRIAKGWETMPHPSHPKNLTGPKHGLEAAAQYSVAFHDIYHPIFVARLYAILHPLTCPATSALGRAMRLYGIVADDG